MSQKVEGPSDAPSEHSEQSMSEDHSQVDIENPDFNSNNVEKSNEEESVPCNVDATENSE
jgi:hypothetical protein